MDWRNDEVLKGLIEKAKQTGSLTFDEVNAALPEMSEPVCLAFSMRALRTSSFFQSIESLPLCRRRTP